jgi:rare lipoprotein A
VNTTMTARPRGLRRRALAAGALGIAVTAVAPAAAEGQSPDGGATAAPERPTVSVAAHKRHALSGQRVKFSGRLSTGEAGRRVAIKRRAGRGYRTIARTTTRSGGRYSVKWRARGTGSFVVRAYVRRNGDAPAAAKRMRGRMRVYVPRHASYYGPGLYGNRLACGGRLSRGTIGVAHKSLPCGTRVTLRNRGRTLTVRVIDRGPYVAGRFYDLTEATKDRLRFGSTGNVWSTK